MNVSWCRSGSSAAPCPVCGSHVPKPHVLVAASLPPGSARPTLLRCVECSTAFYDHLSPPDYSSGTGIAGAVKYYVEQGAAIDVMVGALSRVPYGDVGNFLDIGCGFGFVVDYAARAFKWGSRGIDPSPAARAGRDVLDLPIEVRYLRPGETAEGGPFDLVFSSEVIEHLPDPIELLRTARSVLSPNGVALITTPNAASIDPATPAASLRSILSPGAHLVLFTGEALRRAAAAAGFDHVKIWEVGQSLHAAFALTSDALHRVRDDIAIDRGLYRSYLEERCAAAEPGSMLANGFAWRLFKEYCISHEFDLADRVFAEIEDAYRARYGIELGDPEGLGILLRNTYLGSFETFSASVPFNISGVCFFRGIALMNHHRDCRQALRFFDAAIVSGLYVRGALRCIGADDGETENFIQLSRIYRVLAAGRDHPLKAVAAIFRFGAIPAIHPNVAELWTETRGHLRRAASIALATGRTRLSSWWSRLPHPLGSRSFDA
jgi:SAM-dependent methyltransferase